MQQITFVFHILFIAFFFWLGTPWLMMIPLLGVFLQFLWQGGLHLPEQDRSEYLKNTILKQGIVLARTLIMCGIVGIFDLYSIPRYEVALDLLLVNIAGWFGTAWLDSRDGMRTFHIGIYITLAMIFLFMPWYGSMTNFLLIGAFLSLLTACYGFMTFLIQPLDPAVAQQWGFLLFFYLLVSIFYLIYGYTYNDVYLMVVLGQVLLLVVYIGIYMVQRYSDRIERLHDHEEDLFVRVLSGGTIEGKEKIHEMDTLLGLDVFINTLPVAQKSFIGRINIALMLIQVIIFLWNIGGGVVWMRQIVFWFGIMVFFVNYLLLRNIGFPHRFQRVVAFIMLNFGVYITLVNIFGTNMQHIVSFGIVWSVLSSSIMVMSEGLQKSFGLTREDFITRATANMFACVCNIYFIILLPFSPQLKFSLGFFYIGLQFFLILYGVKKTLKL